MTLPFLEFTHFVRKQQILSKYIWLSIAIRNGKTVFKLNSKNTEFFELCLDGWCIIYMEKPRNDLSFQKHYFIVAHEKRTE